MLLTGPPSRRLCPSDASELYFILFYFNVGTVTLYATLDTNKRTYEYLSVQNYLPLPHQYFPFLSSFPLEIPLTLHFPLTHFPSGLSFPPHRFHSLLSLSLLLLQLPFSFFFFSSLFLFFYIPFSPPFPLFPLPSSLFIPSLLSPLLPLPSSPGADLTSTQSG